MKEHNHQRGIKRGQSRRTQLTAKGRRRLGTGVRFRKSRPRDMPQGQGQQGAPGERDSVAPRHPEGTRHSRPHRPSAGPGPGSELEQPSEGLERASGDKEKEAASCRARGKEGGVLGVGSRGRRRGQLGAYLSSGSASSTACRTEELVVLLEKDGPTRVSTIPPRAPSHRHRSNRNRRNEGAGSSPPLGYWPETASEHAQSPQSRGNPGLPALPAINRSSAPRPRPPPSLTSPLLP